MHPRVNPSPILPSPLLPVRVRPSHSRQSQRGLSFKPKLQAGMISKLWTRNYGLSSKTRVLLRLLHPWTPVRAGAHLLPPLVLLPLHLELHWCHRLTSPCPLECREFWAPPPPLDREWLLQDTPRHPPQSPGRRSGKNCSPQEYMMKLCWINHLNVASHFYFQTLPTGFDPAATPPSDIVPPFPGPNQVSYFIPPPLFRCVHEHLIICGDIFCVQPHSHSNLWVIWMLNWGELWALRLFREVTESRHPHLVSLLDVSR